MADGTEWTSWGPTTLSAPTGVYTTFFDMAVPAWATGGNLQMQFYQETTATVWAEVGVFWRLHFNDATTHTFLTAVPGVQGHSMSLPISAAFVSPPGHAISFDVGIYVYSGGPMPTQCSGSIGWDGLPITDTWPAVAWWGARVSGSTSVPALQVGGQQPCPYGWAVCNLQFRMWDGTTNPPADINLGWRDWYCRFHFYDGAGVLLDTSVGGAFPWDSYTSGPPNTGSDLQPYPYMTTQAQRDAVRWVDWDAGPNGNYYDTYIQTANLEVTLIFQQVVVPAVASPSRLAMIVG